MKFSKQQFVSIALLLTFFVIVLGAYTRLKDAGLGCPDWPGCYGQITAPSNSTEIVNAEAKYPSSPVDTSKARIEMTHRYFAGTLGILILGLFISALRKKENLTLPSILLLLVIFQAALGMWTVTLKLLPIVVMGHLLGGLSILAVLSLYKLNIKHPKEHNSIITDFYAARRVKILATISLFVFIFQIFLGGWTSANYAALTCYDFPYCQGTLFPELNFSKAFNLLGGIGLEKPHLYMENVAKVTIHMLHRFFAVIFLCLTIANVYLSLKANEYSKKVKLLSIKILSLTIIQVLLGIGNIIFTLSIHVATTHNAIAAIILIALVSYNFHVRRELGC